MAKTHEAALARLTALLDANKDTPGSTAAIWDPRSGRAITWASLRLVAELARRG